jgi:L-ascorbate metabolism protein UlaG (beta-lactamase superfamily)
VIEPLLKDDAFLADVEAARGEYGGLHIWWLGQSGFLVQRNGFHLLFDPYLSDTLTRKYASTATPHVRMTERLVAPERLDFIDIVTSTHAHTDHLDGETLRAILGACEHKPCFVLPEANQRIAAERLERVGNAGIGLEPGAESLQSTGVISGFRLTAVRAAHPAVERDGVGLHKFIGFIAEADPFLIYHSGDTVVFDGMADELRAFGRIDVALLPINGKVGNMDGRHAARLAHDIGAKLVVPCHYDMFEFNTASPYELFVPECERLGQPYKVLRAGERLTLTK